MRDELRVLQLEDEPADAELALRELKRAGIAYAVERVDARAPFIAALKQFRPDIILADYHLPAFDGQTALAIARELTPDVPFIFVSGAMGEERAIESLHRGAADYVLKDHLAKLAPAVMRALEEAKERSCRRQAEAGLAESEQRFRKIAESMQDGLVIAGPDAEISYWNNAAERMFGYRADEALGQKLDDLLLPASSRDAFRRWWKRFHDLESVSAPMLELAARRNGGEEIPLELSLSSAPINGSWRAIASIRDVSDRKRADAMRAELAAIVESSEDAVIGKSLGGIITSWNRGAEKMFGYRADETLGKPVVMLAADAVRGEMEAMLDQLRQGRSAVRKELACRCRNGQPIDVSLTLSPIHDVDGGLVGVSTIARDITRRKAAEQALQRSNRFLRTLSRCNETLIHATDELALLRDMCSTVVEAGGFALAWVGYVENDAEKSIRPMAWAGDRSEEYVRSLNLTWDDSERGQGPSGRAVRTGRIQAVQDIAADLKFEPWRGQVTAFGFKSGVSLPLKADGETIGIVSIYSADAGIFSDEESALLAELAADLAFGITTLRVRKQQAEGALRLARSLEETIRAIATTIEMRDPYTAGHQRRVSRLAGAIAREMGMPPEQVASVLRGAEIHDIGKIYIPAEILNRPGRLTDIEFRLIETHPQVGYDIVKDIDFPWPIRTMILQHHERLDGSGYPNGLKGEEILPEARIIAVADVVEAMMNHRPYRAALGMEAALDEIRRGSGRVFEPAAVDACLKLFSEGRFSY